MLWAEIERLDQEQVGAFQTYVQHAEFAALRGLRGFTVRGFLDTPGFRHDVRDSLPLVLGVGTYGAAHGEVQNSHTGRDSSIS